MGTFFSFSHKKMFFPKIDNIFLPKKKIKDKRKKVRPPYWLQKRTPAGPETEVFFRLAWLLTVSSVEGNRKICVYDISN